MVTLVRGPAWMVGVANREDSILSILRDAAVSTNILNELLGGKVELGFFSPIVLKPDILSAI